MGRGKFNKFRDGQGKSSRRSNMSRKTGGDNKMDNLILDEACQRINWPPDRRCKVCGARLSLYNDDILCFPCQEKERDLEFTFWESPKKSKVLKTAAHNWAQILEDILHINESK